MFSNKSINIEFLKQKFFSCDLEIHNKKKKQVKHVFRGLTEDVFSRFGGS
jgi:hypothetical protein